MGRAPVGLPPTGDPLPSGWKRPTPLIIGGVSLILLILLALFFSGRAGEPRFVIKAGAVNVAANKARGTFTMEEVGPVGRIFGTGIPSSGMGGACLAFPAKALGFTEMDKVQCQSNADCSNPPPPGTLPPESFSYAPDPSKPEHRENRYGYCDTASNKCWSKPIVAGGNNAVCNRPLQMTPGTLNYVPVDPVDLGPYNLANKAEVRVVACLNKGAPPFSGPAAPCGLPDSENRMEVLGTASPVEP